MSDAAPFPARPTGARPGIDDRGRATLSLVCEARQGLQPWHRVRIEDLSEGGFRLVWPGNRLSRSQSLRLRVPGLQLLTADIRWVEGAILGCAFATPLHVAVFEHLVIESRRQSGR
ncbi:MAG: PilZ domain-containing protein [Sphingomonadales bacterium]|nr:PilZ domain-containing protein [Sphingomonadales bacterium]